MGLTQYLGNRVLEARPLYSDQRGSIGDALTCHFTDANQYLNSKKFELGGLLKASYPTTGECFSPRLRASWSWTTSKYRESIAFYGYQIIQLWFCAERNFGNGGEGY